MYDVIVIGGGPAGMMAAGTAAERGKRVLLLEKNEKLGKKLYITGKGRCNLTNSCDCEEFLEHVPRNPRFLYSALYSFPPSTLCELIEKLGTPLKIERGRRVFPVSDKSSDIIKALASYLKKEDVHIRLNTAVKGIRIKEEGFLVDAEAESFSARSLVLATGGLSYPATGSTGEGMRFAADLGHKLTPCRPALTSILADDPSLSALSGVSLKNVELCACFKGREIFRERGEMLFTHTGISGPLVLTLSSVLENPAQSEIYIDLKPAVSMEELDRRIIEELKGASGKLLRNSLSGMLINALREPALLRAGIDRDIPANQLNREERRALAAAIKHFSVKCTGYGGYNEAIITRGGINIKEVNPADMQSKIVPGLFFAGEMLDVDAFTGGYNLQIAFSTGRLAGESV